MSILLFFIVLSRRKPEISGCTPPALGSFRTRDDRQGLRNGYIETKWWKHEKSCLFFFNDFFSLQEQGGRYPLFFWFGYFGELDLIGCLQ